MNLRALSDRLRALRPDLAEDGIVRLALFGSRARGDQEPDSDIDLLIDLQSDRPFSLLDLIRVQSRLGEQIGLPVSIVVGRSLDRDFAKQIGSDLIEIF